MALDHVTDCPSEAFLVISDKETSIDPFIEMISKEHHIRYDSHLKWETRKERGEDKIYILKTEQNRPILEIMQIGSKNSKYFCVDLSDLNREGSPEHKHFMDFHKFLKELLEQKYPPNYCI